MVYSAPFVLAQFVKLQTIRFVLTSILLAFGVGAAAAQTSEATGAPTEIKKVSRPMACRQCGKREIWRALDQKWYYEEAKGHIDATAVECHDCRAAKKQK